jgi:hypothetical protein
VIIARLCFFYFRCVAGLIFGLRLHHFYAHISRFFRSHRWMPLDAAGWRWMLPGAAGIFSAILLHFSCIFSHVR